MLDCPENLYTFTCPTVMILHVTVFTNIWRWYSVYIWRTYGPIFNNLLVINDVLPWWLSVSKYVCVMIWRDSTLGKGPLWPLCSLTTSQIWGYNSQVPPPVQVGVLVFAPGSADWLRRYNTTNDIWEILFSNLSSSVQHTHTTHLSSVFSLLLLDISRPYTSNQKITSENSDPPHTTDQISK